LHEIWHVNSFYGPTYGYTITLNKNEIQDGGRHVEFGLSPITCLLLDVFAGNLAGKLYLTSYIQLYHNIKQK